MSLQSGALTGSQPMGHSLLAAGWSAPENISQSANQAVSPVVLVDQQAVHVIWEDQSRLYHRVQQDGTWSTPELVATGHGPAAVLSPDGRVHLVFTNEFAGKFNVFYVSWRQGEWTLPRMVSKTTGMSALPAIALDDTAVPHAVWADMTPGYSVIYHGWLDELWFFEQVRNARGTAPQIVKDKRNLFHVAWQSRGISNGPQDVFHVAGNTYNWTLPENLSLSATVESLGVSMACDAHGKTHVVWQEHRPDGTQIYYVEGRVGNWLVPQAISDETVDASKPAALVTHDLQLSVVWRQQNSIAYRRQDSGGTWHPIDLLVSNDQGLDDVFLSAGADGRLHMAWSAWVDSSRRNVFFSDGRAVLDAHTFLPMVTGGGS